MRNVTFLVTAETYFLSLYDTSYRSLTMLFFYRNVIFIYCIIKTFVSYAFLRFADVSNSNMLHNISLYFPSIFLVRYKDKTYR